ncbi:MAG: response regulator [Anaerolineae bacterium]|nr:response regulator [Anaerolineae bacterium]
MESGSKTGETSLTLGLFMARFGNYQEPIWNGVVQVAREYNAHVLCFLGGGLDSQGISERPQNVVYELASSTNLDGLIVLSADLQNYIPVEEMAQFCARYAPLPVISIAQEVEGVPSIVIDNRVGLCELITHLIDVHHYKRIAFIEGPENNPEAKDRYHAYRKSLERHGIPFDPDLVAPGDFLIESGAEAVRLFLDRRKVSFDAIVASSDIMAIGAWQELTRRGFDVPTDVAITGFDDIREAKTFSMPLTTIHQSLVEQGRQAARMLIEYIQHGTTPKNLAVKTELIIRESCGCSSMGISEKASPASDMPASTSSNALATQRALAFTEMQEVICPYFPGLPPLAIEQLVDAFFEVFKGKSTSQFLPLLGRLLRKGTASLSRAELDEGIMLRWREALAILQNRALSCRDPDAAASIDRLLHQGRILIAQVAERAQANLRGHTEAIMQIQSELVRDINTAPSLQRAVDVLARHLPRLGVRTCILALYEGDAAPSLLSRLIMAYHEGHRFELGPDGYLFPSEQLMPSGILPDDEPSFLVICPLLSHDVHFGFAVMEMLTGSQAVYNIYGSLIEQIASTLYSILLAQELLVSNRQLEQRTDELEKAEKKAEDVSRAKSAFLANMSHEMRTPLNTIIGYSEFIEDECIEAGQENFIPDLKKIQLAARRLLALVNDILDISRIEAGEMELYLETIDIQHMINDIEVIVAPLMEKNANRLLIHCPDDIGTMYTDVTKVRQIILNLLSNAAKFTEDGNITLDVSRRTSEGQNRIIYQVTDTGIGMNDEQMAELFVDFSQVNSSTAREHGGTGLGLVISQQFCRMMGGDIDVESEPGKGSIFTVRLPSDMPQLEQGAAPVRVQPSAAPPGATTVLVIDDDAAVREIVSRYLSKEGFYVETAGSGQEGIRRAREVHPQVITLDVMMPGMDGWAVLNVLKADPELTSIPVVMMTMVAEETMGFALGASDYLTKPVERDNLVSILRRYEPQKSEAPILIVDDDAEVRSVFAQLLRKEGWRVVEAQSGQIALQEVSKIRPALILLDLVMPQMNGFEFIDELHKVENRRSIPIVVVTALPLTAKDQARLTKQVRQVMLKGKLSRDRLLEEVRSILSTVVDNGQSEE